MTVSSLGRTATGTAGWGRLRGLLPSRCEVAEMRRQPRTDVVAGLAVAVVELPLALGFGVSSGAQGRVFATPGEAINAARSMLHGTGVLVPAPRRELLANAARTTL